MFRVTVVVLAALALLAPSVAAAATDELSTTDRLDARRFVTAGPRAYDIGTEAGRYPASGFHTRGEMGGIWSPPVKLLDGIWFGLDGTWIGPATQFTSGHGYVKMALPGKPGLSVERTDFVPGESRGVLVGLHFTASGAEQTFDLAMQAHSELMSSYPWGETTAGGQPFNQTTFNLPDQAAASADGNALVFTEDGTPPLPGAPSTTGPPRSARTSPPTRPTRRRRAPASAARSRSRLASRRRARRSAARPARTPRRRRSPAMTRPTARARAASSATTSSSRRAARRRSGSAWPERRPQAAPPPARPRRR